MQRELYCLAVHKILLSHTELLTSIAYKLKQLLSCFTHRNITFVIVAPFRAFVCKLARVVVLASCGSNTTQQTEG